MSLLGAAAAKSDDCSTLAGAKVGQQTVCNKHFKDQARAGNKALDHGGGVLPAVHVSDVVDERFARLLERAADDATEDINVAGGC